MQLAPRSEGSWVHRSGVEIKFVDGNKRHGVTAVPKGKNIKENPQLSDLRERRTRAVQEVTGWKEERKRRRREYKEAGRDRKVCDHSQDEQDETDPVWILRATRTRTHLRIHTRARGEGRGDLVTRADVERNRMHTSATACPHIRKASPGSRLLVQRRDPKAGCSENE